MFSGAQTNHPRLLCQSIQRLYAVFLSWCNARDPLGHVLQSVFTFMSNLKPSGNDHQLLNGPSSPVPPRPLDSTSAWQSCFAASAWSWQNFFPQKRQTKGRKSRRPQVSCVPGHVHCRVILPVCACEYLSLYDIVRVCIVLRSVYSTCFVWRSRVNILERPRTGKIWGLGA